MNMVADTVIAGNINELSDRMAMGFNDGYRKLRFQNIEFTIEQLRKMEIHELLLVVENPSTPIAHRYAAGQLLAILGDPRIDNLNPQMLTIKSGVAKVGLPFERIDNIVAQYKNLGVLKEWIEKECPHFETPLPEFKLAKYPLTNQEYQRFLLDRPDAEIPSSWAFGRYPLHLSNHPVYTISEESAEEYCQWISKRTGRKFRLPTEVEWEYAASGPDGTEFPWGDYYEEDRANTAEFGLFASTPVGIFIEGASHFNVLDMAGNVEEYTSDDYWTYPGGREVMDDLMEKRGSYKVARGGSFTRFRDLARCARRHGRYHKEIYVMGFRLAESI
ncbi:MAG: SUMF1/EgtB/PvdO family nonheme iron enzyme [Pseudomonadales bacterium]|nr:SUMF1/EgtB/PvdO family nonheme iron enzyme [Pseudomonadales bacterium]